MPAKIVGEFLAGDDVPEWLFSLEPVDPNSDRPETTFEVDCVVVETRSGYFVLPEWDEETQRDHVIRQRGKGHYRVVTSGTPVRISYKWQSIEHVE